MSQNRERLALAYTWGIRCSMRAKYVAFSTARRVLASVRDVCVRAGGCSWCGLWTLDDRLEGMNIGTSWYGYRPMIRPIDRVHAKRRCNNNWQVVITGLFLLFLLRKHFITEKKNREKQKKA